ncbi:hypothetical protein BC940DRAFT_294148 [Gongronella butleri]|nr:hypothetical protein BC940DRAFT_294148 [Gongronella butleri]
MIFSTWPCLMLVLALFATLHCAAPTVQDTHLTAAQFLNILHAARMKCTAEELGRLESTYLGSDFADIISACTIGGLPGRGSCPPGGLAELIAEYPNRFSLFINSLSQCEK